MKYFTFLLLLASICFHCPAQNITLTVEDNNLEICYRKKKYLSGACPFLESDTSHLHIVKKDMKGATASFVFSDESLHREIVVEALPEENKDVITFRLSGVHPASLKGDDFIGLFFKQLTGYQTGTAYYRYKPIRAWTAPVKIRKMTDLKEDDITFFIWQYDDGVYAAAMPLGGNGYSATLGRTGEHFAVKSVSLKDNTPIQDVPLLAVAFGNDPYRMIDDLYETGMDRVGEKQNLRVKKNYPEVLEHIGWCTWNAYGHQLNQHKIMEGVRTFTQQNFPLSFLLIDDGWLTVSGANGGLKSFTPDTLKFPLGFKPLVDSLHQVYHIKNVGLWHTLNGYWAGVDPDGELGVKYKDILVPYQDRVTWTDKPVETFYAPAPVAGGYHFYDDWYSYLKSQGISFVKVDNQLIIDRIARNNYPLWDAGKQMESNLHRAVQKHFNGAIINCMDMTTDALYHYSQTSVARVSEDFLPENTTYNMEGGNAAVHVLCAVSNALWLSEMAWPDYDMFQSHHLDAEFHAVARAISGGPVYVTDTPGKQNFAILKALTYRDGRIIRADVPARPTKDCLFQLQEAKPFKAFTVSNGVGLLAAFNVADSDEVSGRFAPSDVYGLQGKKIAVYDFFKHTVKLVESGEQIPISLGRMGYKLFLLAPMLKNTAAVLGLINKYNAPKTITRQQILKNEIQVTLPEGGVLGVYMIRSPKRIWVDGELQSSDSYSFNNGLLQLTIPDIETLNSRFIKITF